MFRDEKSTLEFVEFGETRSTAVLNFVLFRETRSNVVNLVRFCFGIVSLRRIFHFLPVRKETSVRRYSSS